jgi:hypothetical protein
MMEDANRAVPPRGRRYRLGTAGIALAIVALAGWAAAAFAEKRDRWQVMGAIGIPNRCTVDVDASGVDRAELAVEYFRRDSDDPPRKIFEGRTCRSFPGSSDSHGFVIRHRGAVVCGAEDFDKFERGGMTYRIRCSQRTGRVVCSVERPDGYVYLATCNGGPLNVERAF